MFKSKDIRVKSIKNCTDKIKLNSARFIGSHYSEQKMNVEASSKEQELKLTQWQQKVIRDARVTDRCTTLVSNFEDSVRIKRLMQDARNYKLMTLADLKLICLNKGCHALPCAEHYQRETISDTHVHLPSLKVELSPSSTMDVIDGSRKTKDGVEALGLLFQKMDKFYTQSKKQEKKEACDKVKLKSEKPKKPKKYLKSIIFNFPWKKVLCGKSKSKKSTGYIKIGSHDKIDSQGLNGSHNKRVFGFNSALDTINMRLVYNHKLLSRFKPKTKSIKSEHEIFEATTEQHGNTIIDQKQIDLILNRISYLEKTNSIVRLRGGMYNNKATQQVMVVQAIESAKKHNINLTQGILNKADGNCAFESVINNINYRHCFEHKLQHSVQTYRQRWMTNLENKSSEYPTLGAGFTDQEQQEN